MSTTRLTFLYPHLFRSVRVSDPVAKTARARARTSRVQCQPVRSFATSERTRRHSAQRHGKAVEPYSTSGAGAENQKGFPSLKDGNEMEKDKELKKSEERASTDSGNEGNEVDGKPKSKDSVTSSAAPLSDGMGASAASSEDSNASQQESGIKAETTTPPQDANKFASPAPLETVLQMPPPESPEQENATKPPHLQTPPYVHHFDTYTLVQQVEAGDFTTEQSITAMKAVRGLLAHNLDIAKAGLVSKSDVENVSFVSAVLKWSLINSPFRKAISFVRRVLNCGQRSKISARQMRKPCAGSGRCYNTKWIVSTKNLLRSCSLSRMT